MNNGITSGHPRVTVERRPAGPLVVQDRRSSEEAIKLGWTLVVIACLVGIALVASILVSSSRTGQVDESDLSRMVLAVGIPIGGIVYLIFQTRKRVEVAVAGEWLQIRPRPFNVGRGQDINREQIDHIQLEEGNRYRVQFVDAEGNGLLPQKSGLSRIPTQDEATAVAGSIAQQFGLRFVPGIQAKAIPSASLGEKHPISAENTDSELIKPVDIPPGALDGYIRLRQSKEGNILIYAKSAKTRLETGLFAVIWLGFCLRFTSTIFPRGAGEGEPLIWLNLAVFWIAGFVMLGSAFSQKVFLTKGEQLVYQTRLVGMVWEGGRIPLVEILRVGLDVYWDSYNEMHYRVVAQVELGQDHVLVGDIPEADGNALCMALNRQFGVPV